VDQQQKEEIIFKPFSYITQIYIVIIEHFQYYLIRSMFYTTLGIIYLNNILET